MASIITTHDLTKRYGDRIGVDRLALDVPEGAVFGFLGPNGSGKTTTIRLLLGFLRPTSGRARVFGVDGWTKSRQIKRDVGYLPGDLRLYSWMNVRNGLRLLGRVRGRDLRRGGLDLAERFRLDPDVRVRKMSRGMRQKLGLILALAHDPRLLILDEPTSGLDPLMQGELAACLRERADAGRTVFFSSHALGEVEHLCERIAIVRDGTIVADETLEALRRRARREVTIVFTDAHAASVPPPDELRVRERDGAVWRGELDSADAGVALVRWLARQPLRDVTIGRPDLETVFRSFYGEREESG